MTLALQEHEVRPGTVELVVLDDPGMAELNRSMRGVEGATDVLTFPAPLTAEGHVGEVALCLSFVLRGAEARGVSPSQEAAMLALHGALHLAGMDDQTEADQRLMLLEMNRIASLTGVKPDSHWASQPHP
jgi:rRNA maturation RNase YbeY